jgi:hypothetical protein
MDPPLAAPSNSIFRVRKSLWDITDWTFEGQNESLSLWERNSELGFTHRVEYDHCDFVNVYVSTGTIKQLPVDDESSYVFQVVSSGGQAHGALRSSSIGAGSPVGDIWYSGSVKVVLEANKASPAALQLQGSLCGWRVPTAVKDLVQQYLAYGNGTWKLELRTGTYSAAMPTCLEWWCDDDDDDDSNDREAATSKDGIEDQDIVVEALR